MRNREKRILRDIWGSLSYELSNKGWGQHGSKLLALTKEESKNHNRGRPEGVAHYMTIDQEAKFFACKRVVEYLTGHKAPLAQDFTHMQTSCFYAYGLVHDYRDDLTAWLEKHHHAWDLVTWDYSRLIKSEPPYPESLLDMYTEAQSTGTGFYLVLTSPGHRQFFGPWHNREHLNAVTVNWKLDTAQSINKSGNVEA